MLKSDAAPTGAYVPSMSWAMMATLSPRRTMPGGRLESNVPCVALLTGVAKLEEGLEEAVVGGHHVA